jgi:hypothetical protein
MEKLRKRGIVPVIERRSARRRKTDVPPEERT